MFGLDKVKFVSFWKDRDAIIDYPSYEDLGKLWPSITALRKDLSVQWKKDYCQTGMDRDEVNVQKFQSEWFNLIHTIRSYFHFAITKRRGIEF